MRIVKIIFIVIFVVITLGIMAGVIFVKTFDINRYKPQIIAAAKDSTNRELDFSTIDLNVSIAQGVRVAIRDIVLGEDPAFGSENFLTIEEVYLGVDVMAYLRKKHISIVKASVKRPKITIIRTQEGLLNAQTLASTAGSARGGEGSVAAAHQSTTAPQEMMLPAIFVDTVEVLNATVTVIDRSLEPELNVVINDLNLGINGFSLNAPFTFFAAGSVFGPTENFRIEGLAQVDPKSLEIKLTQVKSVTDFKKFSLKQIRDLPVLPKEIPFPEVLEGKLSLLLKELTVGPAGLGSFHVDLKLEEGAVAIKEVAPGVSFEGRHMDLSLTDFSLHKPFNFSLKSAYLSPAQNIFIDGKGSFDLDTQAIRIFNTHIKTDLSTLALAQLKSSVTALAEVPFPDELGGTVAVSLKELSADPKGLGLVNADVLLNDGRVVLNELAPGVGFLASKANISIKNFSLDDSFRLKGEVAYLSDAPNISFDGDVSFDMITQEIKLNAFDFKTELSSFSMERLRQSVAALKDASLPRTLKGGLNVALSSMTAGPKGLVNLNGRSVLSDGAVTLKELIVMVSDIHAKVELAGSGIIFPPSSFKLGSGKVTVSGKLDQYLTTQEYQLNSKLEALSLMEIVEQKDFPVKVHGIVDGVIEMSGTGFDPTKMLDALKGAGDFAISEGKLTDINILKLVLDKLSFIPNLSRILEENLPVNFKDKIKKKDTIVTAIRMNIGIAQGVILLNFFDMEADGFFFKGKGKASFDQSFDFDGVFIIPQELAQSMAKAANELELLYDEQGQIQFPLKVSGKGADVKFMPDIKAVTTNAIKNKGREELQKVLDKALGNKNFDSIQKSSPGDSSEPAPQQQKAPEQILIEGVLDSLFRK